MTGSVDQGMRDVDKECLGKERKWETITNAFSFISPTSSSLSPSSLFLRSITPLSEWVEERKHINEFLFSTLPLPSTCFLSHSPFATQRLNYENTFSVRNTCLSTDGGYNKMKSCACRLVLKYSGKTKQKLEWMGYRIGRTRIAGGW